MKFKKSASGQNKVTFSQKDWEEFGKKAGWMADDGGLLEDKKDTDDLVEAEVAMPAPSPIAPPKPGTTPTETPTEKPGPGKRKIRKPNRKTKRAPKGEERLENEVSPESLPTIASELKKKLADSSNFFQKTAQVYPDMFDRLWGNIPPDYPVGNNEFLTNSGGQLSRENYDYLINHAREKNINLNGISEPRIMGLVDRMQAIETEYREELIELAKVVVADEWGIDKDDLDASFMDQKEGSGQPQKDEGEEAPMTPELQEEIGKRSVLNGLSQGAGLHALLSLHHLGPIKLDEIVEQLEAKGNLEFEERASLEKFSALQGRFQELLPLYDEFGTLISMVYYMMDPEQLRGLEAMLAESGTGWSTVNDDDQVEGKGLSFSIICQELVKGLVGQYADHQFDDGSRQNRGLEPLTEEQERTITNNADQLWLESLQIQFGTELWRKFLTSSEDVEKLGVISYISAGPTHELDNTMGEVTANPEIAKAMLSDIQQALDEGDGFHEYEGADGAEGAEGLGEDGLDPEGHEIPDEEKGELPDDAADIERQLAEMFTQPERPDAQPPRPHDEDDDDDDEPFHLPWA